MKRTHLLVVVLLAVISSLTSFTAARAEDDLAAKLTATEKGLWEAWKNHDSAPFAAVLAEGTVNVNAGGVQVGKAATIAMIADKGCEVKGYALSDIQVHTFGDCTAILTYHATQDGACAGQKLPAAVNASSVYVKVGDAWVAASHQETPAEK